MLDIKFCYLLLDYQRYVKYIMFEAKIETKNR